MSVSALRRAGPGSREASAAIDEERPSAQRPAGPATAVLDLQRTHGNRSVARSMTMRLARVPAATATPLPPHARPERTSRAEQTIRPNRPLAKEIDALERLTDEALAAEREVVSVRASTFGRDHERDVLELEAIEFLAAQRGVAPLAYRDEYYHHDEDGVRRRNVRVLLEAGIRETGSLAAAAERIEHKSGSVERSIGAIESEAHAFGSQFTGQARTIAAQMLRQSVSMILRTLHAYGLDPEFALRGANDMLAGHDVDDVVEGLVNTTAVWEADSYEDDTSRPRPGRQHRRSLAHDVRALKAQQQAVERLRAQMAALIKHSSARGEYIENPAAYDDAKQRFEQAERRLAVQWARAEGRHPALASFRNSAPMLQNVDLGALDQIGGAAGAKPQMRTMLKNVLPKLRDIGIIQYRLQAGTLSPLALPPVVALTKAAMFVPDGSIRAGKVNDLVEAAQDTSVAKYLGEGLLALLVLATLVPSGGTTMGVAIGLASAAFSATSAVEDWESYQQKRMLANTALDRAKALSTEDPSLLPFAVDLISLGLDGLPLLKAFHVVSEIRKLIRGGHGIQSTKDLEQLLKELDALGATKGESNLGEQVLKDLQSAERDTEASTTASEESGEAKRQTWRAPPGQPHATVEELRAAIQGPLRSLRHGAHDVNREWRELMSLDWAGLVRKHPKHEKLLEQLNMVYWARRDPDRIERLIVRVYTEAGHAGLSPQAWIVRHFGGPKGMPELTELTQSSAPFRKALRAKKPMIDQTYSFTKHGAYIHIFDELLVEDVLGSQEAARQFRRAIAKAKGPEVTSQVTKTHQVRKTLSSAIWDALFDAGDIDQLNSPEGLGSILIDHLGFLGETK